MSRSVSLIVLIYSQLKRKERQLTWVASVRERKLMLHRVKRNERA
jgi:heme exporter protein D